MLIHHRACHVVVRRVGLEDLGKRVSEFVSEAKTTLVDGVNNRGHVSVGGARGCKHRM